MALALFGDRDGCVWFDGKPGPTPIAITRTREPKVHPADEDLRFGSAFTDHMFLMDYTEGKGWHDPRIVPYQPLPLDPATSVLHYAQSVFDGLKAYRGRDGVIRFFRAARHADRLNRSCGYLCIPPLDPELVLQSFHALVGIDQAWVPAKRGTSLICVRR